MSDEAAKREANGDAGPLTIEWEGSTFVVPAAVDDWDADVIEAFEKGQAVTAIRGLLGTKTYDQLKVDFQKKTGRKLAVKDLGSLGDLIASTYGLEKQGE